MNIHGTPRYITEDLIDSVLSGIEGSVDRVGRLFSPVWVTEVSEYAFDDAHVRILWHGPFRKEVAEYTVETGGRATAISLSHQMSELDSVGINFVRTNARWTVPAASAISTATSTLRAIGISEPDVLASQWRSRVAAEGAGSTNTAHGMVFASVRIVEAAELDGFWQILAVSGASTLEALRLREAFESSLQLVAASR